MSCMLRISGTNFNVKHFLSDTNLTYSNLYQKGEPRLESKPEGKKNLMSGINYTLSDAGFCDHETQTSDAIAYLEKHKQQLSIIRSIPEIEFALIDFGLEFPDDTLFVKSFYFDPKLVAICGELGLAIEVSIYREAEKEV